MTNDNEYLNLIKLKEGEKRDYIMSSLYDKFLYCRPLTIKEQDKLQEIGQFENIPRDLRNIYLCQNFNSKYSKYKCYNTSKNKFMFCYKCNQEMLKIKEVKRIRTYSNPSSEEDEKITI